MSIAYSNKLNKKIIPKINELFIINNFYVKCIINNIKTEGCSNCFFNNIALKNNTCYKCGFICCKEDRHDNNYVIYLKIK